MKSEKEQQYTSTTAKLLHNLDRLKEIQEGIIRPISVQIAPTDKCNLNCIFCSVKNREKNELNIEQSFKVIRTFKSMGAKTLEITGGGDPTCYENINELIEEASNLGYKIGLISNGVLLNKKITVDNLSTLTWVRISLNSLDYVEDIELDIPTNVVLGFSYVWNKISNDRLANGVDMMQKIEKYREKYGAKYVRVVPDCLADDVLKERERLQKELKVGGDYFIQDKEYDLPRRCWLGYIKPFVNSDGFVYHCSANPLINRKFNSSFRLCSIDGIEETWKNIKPFDTGVCKDGKCFFKEHSELIEQVMTKVDHGDFI
jgi:MoaA/NifB/PqqE/SkfB family radical SAM enzyme